MFLDAEGTRTFTTPPVCTTPSHEFIFYAAMVLLFLSLSFFISLVTVCIAYFDLKNKFVKLTQTLPTTVSPSCSPSPANITSTSFVQNLSSSSSSNSTSPTSTAPFLRRRRIHSAVASPPSHPTTSAATTTTTIRCG